MRFFILALLSFFLLVLSLFLGRYTLTFFDLHEALQYLFTSSLSRDVLDVPQSFTVLWYIRLPRILAAFAVGASLSCAGATAQALFRNPLVSPDILGAASGAAFGAALGILCTLSTFGIQIFSFIGGLAAVLLTLLIYTQSRGGTSTLVLSGIMISALGNSLISLLKTFADSSGTLPAITFWLMGSLANIGWSEAIYSLLIALFCNIILLFLSWRLNVLSLGNEQADSLGLNVKRLRVIFIALITLLTASAVSVSGIIGWVGLLVPHMARNIFGSDYRKVLPSCALLGGSFLLLIDTISRTASTAEAPLGVLTSIIGVPFFVFLIIRRNKNRYGRHI